MAMSMGKSPKSIDFHGKKSPKSIDYLVISLWKINTDPENQQFLEET
jgi:hypothetical protein